MNGIQSNNQFFNPNLGGLNPIGYVPNPNPNPPKYTQTLTKEQIQSLRQNSEKFSLDLSQEEVLRGICFHRNEDGTPAYRVNPDNTLTCLICGYTFDPVQNMTDEDIQNSVNGIVDVLQTIKLLFLDMPVEPAKEFFQVIPLLNKVPKLFKVATDNFSRHEQYVNYQYAGTPNTVNLYNMLNGNMPIQPMAYNPTINTFQGAQGQPLYGNPGAFNQGVPFGGPQAPIGMQPMMGQPLAPGSNGFVNYAQPQGYQPAPAVNGFQYNPVGQPVAGNGVPADAVAAPPQGAIAPAAAAPVATPDGNVTVDATFKA